MDRHAITSGGWTKIKRLNVTLKGVVSAMRNVYEAGKHLDSGLSWRSLISAALCLLLFAAAAHYAARTAMSETMVETKSETNASADGLQELSLSRDQALWAALAFEDGSALRRLLNEGVNPDRPDELSMMTPLMAVETATLANILLEAGASVTARDRLGRTPLHYAVRMREAVAVISLMTRRGADPNAHAAGAKGATPLITAVEAFFEDMDKARCAQLVGVLVTAGARVDEADDRGDTPLALAAVNNATELVKLLLQLGANPALRLKDGRTAADYARERGSSEVAALLDHAVRDRVRE